MGELGYLSFGRDLQNVVQAIADKQIVFAVHAKTLRPRYLRMVFA